MSRSSGIDCHLLTLAVGVLAAAISLGKPLGMKELLAMSLAFLGQHQTFPDVPE